MYVDLPKKKLWKSAIFHSIKNVCWSTKNLLIRESAIYHSIKLPFDMEVAEKFLNGIYYIIIPITYLLQSSSRRSSSVICRYLDHKKQYYIWFDYQAFIYCELFFVKRLAQWLKGSLCTIWWTFWWSETYYSKHTIHMPHDFSF